MSGGYLLDTDVLSEPLRPKPDKRVLSLLRRHEGALATCTPVWHELLFGCFRLPPSKRRSVIEEYLFGVVWATIPVLSYDPAAGRWHAEQRARLTALGRTPPFVDGQIAAIAKVNDLVVVSGNVVHYRGFAGLRTANWFRRGRKAAAR